MGSVTIEWSTIIVALIAATSAGTRLSAWMRANKAVVRIIVGVVEHLAGIGDEGAKRVKSMVGSETEAIGGAVRLAADALAASAEKRNGGARSATRKSKASRGASIVREVSRWIPLLGAFR